MESQGQFKQEEYGQTWFVVRFKNLGARGLALAGTATRSTPWPRRCEEAGGR